MHAGRHLHKIKTETHAELCLTVVEAWKSKFKASGDLMPDRDCSQGYPHLFAVSPWVEGQGASLIVTNPFWSLHPHDLVASRQH